MVTGGKGAESAMALAIKFRNRRCAAVLLELQTK
jgi:hypothetical protein